MQQAKQNTWKAAMIRAALLMTVVNIVGVFGFKWIGKNDASWLDAIYMTTITVTTVGYGEVIAISHSTAGKIFTVGLLFFGVGAFLNFFSLITAYLIEGTLDQVFWKRRMDRTIKKLKGHYIVCGAGHTGVHIVRELMETERDFVLIDTDRARLDAMTLDLGSHAQIHGDATNDKILLAAGIERAKGLFACLGGDKDNLITTFSSRMLCETSMRIVSRCIDEHFIEKMKKAGANAVVSPNAIGGLRLVSEMIRPTTVSFLDRMLRNKEERLRVEDLCILPDSSLDKMTIVQLRETGIDILPVALHNNKNDVWHYNPSDRTILQAEMSIVFIGSPQARQLLEKLNLSTQK